MWDYFLVLPIPWWNARLNLCFTGLHLHSMHASYYAAATPVVIFVVFNSFVHTIMYFYYALTTVGFQPPGKKYLTSLQIAQFLVGMTCAASFFGAELYGGKGSCFKSTADRDAVFVNLIYLLPLTYLFFQFMHRTYTSNRLSKRVEVKRKEVLKEE
jgi:hypothetical protein